MSKNKFIGVTLKLGNHIRLRVVGYYNDPVT